MTDIDITIGSDPEFVILCGEFIQIAGDIFSQISDHEYCGSCNICTNCTACEFEIHINFDDIESITAIVNKTIEENIDFITKDFLKISKLEGPLYKEEAKVLYIYELVLPYLNKEKLKEYIIREITDSNLNRDDSIDADHMARVLAKAQKEVPENLISDYIYNGRKFLRDIYNKIYDAIEFKEEEPTCRYDTSQCGICENCDTCLKKLTESKAEIGCDEQTAIGELRPAFSTDPIKHFEEIRILIEDLFDMLSSYGVCGPDSLYQIKAGGWQIDYSLGGHIHIGYPEKILQMILSPEEKTKINNDLGLYLSYLAGILLKRLEHTFYIEHREMRAVGFFNDWKDKDYGLEWRMPASFLVSPEMTRGALCLSFVVSYEFFYLYLNDRVSLRKDISAIIEEMYTQGTLSPIFFNQDEYNSYVKSSYIDYKYYIDSLIDAITDMKLYNKYSKYIEPIFGMIFNDEKWNAEIDIFSTWIETNKLKKSIVQSVNPKGAYRAINP